MKKFLTVLLALSVVFTYTVGTAFAASNITQNTNDQTVTDQAKQSAYDAAMNYAENKISAAVDAQKGEDLADEAYEKEAILYAAEKTKDIGGRLTNDMITEYLRLGGSDGMAYTGVLTEFKAEIDKWVDATNADNSILVGTSGYDYAKINFKVYYDETVKAKDLSVRLDAAKAIVNAVDPSTFIEDDQAEVTKLKADALNDLKAVKVDSTIKNKATPAVALPMGSTAGSDSTYVDVINSILYGYELDQVAASAEYVKNVYTKTDKVSTLPKADADPVFAGFVGKVDALTTIAEQEGIDAGGKIDAEYAKAKVAYDAKVDFYGAHALEAGDSASTKLTGITADGTTPVVDASAKTVFGISVKNITSVTADEATKINTALMSAISDAISVFNVYFDELKITSTGASGTIQTSLNTNFADNNKILVSFNKAMKAMDAYATAEKTASRMKSEVLFNGQKKYDSAKVDEALAKDKTDIYANFLGSASQNNLSKVPVAYDEVEVAIQVASDKFDVTTIVTSGSNKTPDADKKYIKAYYDQAYYGDDYDEVKNDTQDALMDAKTVEEVNTIVADADAKLAKLRTKAEYDALDKAEVVRYQTALASYATTVQAGLMNANNDYRADSFTALVKAYNGTNNDAFDVLANCGKIELVKNIEEVKALYEEAKTALNNLKTDKEIDAGAEKVEKLIGALPASVVMADEAKFQEAYDAYKAYLDIYGADKADIRGYYGFENKMAQLKKLQVAAVEAAANALPSNTAVTTSDKEAINAARAMYDKYVDYYDQYDEAFVANVAKLTAAESALRTAEINAVIEVISKLTDASTLDDITAAQKAYDELTGSQQRDLKKITGEAFLYKLETAKEKLVAAVEALKITASSTAGKGYIKVKWTVKGDAAAADGYQVYRSTKRNSGFGTKPYFTTKNKTYKNTKSLKKGKRYYYKVRAYKVVDGKKIYSDWSNKAYRIAK